MAINKLLDKTLIKIIFTLLILITMLLFSRCSKDDTPKVFPPVQTCPGIPFVEYGGEKYPTVLINNRCWFAKNLNIGTMITVYTQMTDNGIIEKYCYADKSENGQIYGGLYQWEEIMQYQTKEESRGICPEGWHIPTNREFVELLIYCDNYWPYLISNSSGYWNHDFEYPEYQNLSGFSALPGGWSFTEGERFFHLNEEVAFWSSKAIDDSIAIAFGMPDDIWLTNQIFSKPEVLSAGLSVRCIKDE
jgi:uncharacterized protein (TIGR02145 family)